METNHHKTFACDFKVIGEDVKKSNCNITHITDVKTNNKGGSLETGHTIVGKAAHDASFRLDGGIIDTDVNILHSTAILKAAHTKNADMDTSAIHKLLSLAITASKKAHHTDNEGNIEAHLEGHKEITTKKEKARALGPPGTGGYHEHRAKEETLPHLHLIKTEP